MVPWDGGPPLWLGWHHKLTRHNSQAPYPYRLHSCDRHPYCTATATGSCVPARCTRHRESGVSQRSVDELPNVDRNDLYNAEPSLWGSFVEGAPINLVRLRT